jgi:hypothetical protein
VNDLDRLQRRSLVLGLGAAAVGVVAGLFAPAVFFRSYLVAWLFWLGISLGCLSILMLQHLSGGAWAIVIRRLLESGARTVPLMALLFLPILFGLGRLYAWTHAEALSADPRLADKHAYLNVPFFLVRAATYFLVWSALAHFLGKWSRAQDGAADPSSGSRMQRLSGPGLVLVVLSVTFASVDWVMSVEPHWFSTIYGALFLVGHALGGLSFAIAVLVLLMRREPLRSAVSPAHLHDLGKLLLAFVMVWAYFAFSQFLIVWAGNLPDEIPWYLRRLQGGWQWVGLAVVLGQFVLPFALLLSRQTKRDSRSLQRLAAGVVVLRLADMCWMVVPAFSAPAPGTLALVLALALALGGLWLSAFFRALRAASLLPLGDPQLEEALAHGSH